VAANNTFASYFPELPLISFCRITFISGFIVRWTKLFLIDVLHQKIKRRKNDANNFVIFLKFIKFHKWKVNFKLMMQGD